MYYYEIVLMVHPDKSDVIQKIIERYRSIITSNNGHIKRLEDWGRRQMAYPIKKLHKAHYILMNIEVAQETMKELKNGIDFNEDIIRSMILRMKKSVTQPSPMIKIKEVTRYDNPDGLIVDTHYNILQ